MMKTVLLNLLMILLALSNLFLIGGTMLYLSPLCWEYDDLIGEKVFGFFLYAGIPFIIAVWVIYFIFREFKIDPQLRFRISLLLWLCILQTIMPFVYCVTAFDATFSLW